MSKTTALAPFLVVALAASGGVVRGAELCLGIDCGADKASYRCHSVSAAGVECWSPDDGCEVAAGFSRERDGALPCPLRLSSFPGSGLIAVIGGREVLHEGFPPRRPGAQTRSTQGLEGAPPRPSPGPRNEAAGAHFDAVTTTLEREDWSFADTRGKTWGAAVAWLRETATGHRFSAEVSAQRAEPRAEPRGEPKLGAEAELVHVAVGYGHRLELPGRLSELEAWWGVAAQGTQLDLGAAGADGTGRFGGATAHLAAARTFVSGGRLAGAVVLQGNTGDDLGEDLTSVGLGAAYDLPIGRRVLVQLEVFAVRLMGSAASEDEFAHLAALGTWFASERFALTLGYRTLEGVAGLESATVTLGASRRFE